jgi:acyl-CoA thioester hydrolase
MSEQGASVRIRQRIELCDTDITGHYHHSTVVRWVEAAERTLLREIGLAELPVMPRVKYDVNYRRRLWRDQIVQIDLAVAAVGRTSLSYRFAAVCTGAECVDGTLIVVVVNEDGHKRPWTEHERKLLLDPGRVRLPPGDDLWDPAFGDPWGLAFG